MTLFRTVVVALLVVFALDGLAEQPPKLRRYPGKVMNQYIVVLSKEHKARARQLANTLPATYPGKVLGVFDQVLGGFSIEMPEPCVST